MTSNLPWFTVRLALLGVSEEQSSEAIRDLLAEFNMRPHLKNAQVFWQAESRQVIVQVNAEGLNTNSVSEGMAEELKEMISAIFTKVGGVHVELLSAHPFSR
jgi:hypothetical protein